MLSYVHNLSINYTIFINSKTIIKFLMKKNYKNNITRI